MGNIVQQAKQIIYNSEIMLYVSPEKIEEAFQKIYVFEDKYEFLQAYGRSDYDGERLEGFNRSSGSYLGPDATPHTVIHEVLHGLSSEFDKEGHRIINGISGDGSWNYGVRINEGITDYLAAKLSGETPRHYIRGHKLFARLEPMMAKYTENPNILMQIYLNKDLQFVHDFLNYYGKDNVFENLYSNFEILSDEKLNGLLDKVEKNLNKDLKKRERKEKINNFIDKVKNIFAKKDKGQKLLTDGSEHQIDSHQGFVNQYDINNFQSTMTQEDIQRYNEYQQENIKESVQKNDGEREDFFH